jgi:hypothetical protein
MTMSHADGQAHDGPVDGEVDLDDDDLSPNVRRFLQIIADEDESGATRAERRLAVDRERRVTRFAWTCEELNVAFADLRSDLETISLLADHGVTATLAEIHAKAGALLRAIEGDPPS